MSTWRILGDDNNRASFLLCPLLKTGQPQQPLQISNLMTQITGKNNELFFLSNYWIDFMLINQSCGFIALGHSKFNVRCEHCEVFLATQDFQYYFGHSGADKVRISRLWGKYSTSTISNHKKHVDLFKGCDINIVPPAEDCLHIKKLK